MVPVRKNLARALHHAVEPARDADRQPLQAARELRSVGGLHYEVDVVPPHREVDQPEPLAIAAVCESGRELSERAPASEIPDMREHAPGDVDRVMPG